ncbi:hypothetical protein RJ639_005306 [Escallonia herrerae]|uniref:Transcriptional elongation regulator MINIYO n=1 Tax=Escallonia herrerae TaxID=1293975 RepID=A0AA88VVF4_9ASTE|nr:hypothetical protein RJ639_005306 [Escallonia herrerae]
MKKLNGGNTAKKPSRQNFTGNGSLKLGDDADASFLVGGIVEKGFSQESGLRPVGPSSSPRPTVLPFPVARHRSHGPYWAPKVSDNSDNAGNDEDDEMLAECDPVAAFANPIQRKQKKGMDFSRWREIGAIDKDENNLLEKSQQQNNVSEGAQISEKTNRHSGVEAMVTKGAASNLDNDKFVNKEERYFNNGVTELEDEVMEDMESGFSKFSRKQIQVDIEGHNGLESCITSSHGSSQLGNGHGASSLGSQIDAENRARLEGMSAEEIAEAQAELMKKMNPELIKKLKKRGEDKLKMQKCSSSDTASSGQVGNLQDEKTLRYAYESDTAPKVMASDSKDTHEGLDDKFVQNLTPAIGGSWEAWSKRVEAVRKLRFSLDGNVIEADFALVPETADSGEEVQTLFFVVLGLQHKCLYLHTMLMFFPLYHVAGKISSLSGYNADNVAERDFLRTEGDPAAAGYTISEALALIRSVVPGQRALALHLLASVLDKAPRNICQNQVGPTLIYADTGKFVDWEAVWTFTLGPEPELALLLRMSFDDNHNSVVLACAKVIQCVLSCDATERFFDVSEKLPTYQKDVCTAPVFRSRPKIDFGFLNGGFWKYNTKPSNILPFGESVADDKPEVEHTIQDDTVVAGQDFAAGLVRMGILGRIRYLLEIKKRGWLGLEIKKSGWLMMDVSKIDTVFRVNLVVRYVNLVALHPVPIGYGLGTLQISLLCIHVLADCSTDPSPPLEECIISILIAIARHSPTSADAIMKCPRLVQVVVNRFTMKDQMEINPSKIKSVTLFKVLARCERRNCIAFIKDGIFQKMTWHLYRYAFSLDQWIKLGRENCKLSSALLIEQIRFWKVCIQYGYCVSYFADLFPALCIWLNVPSFETLVGNNILHDFANVSKEVYLALEALTRRLPNFYSDSDLCDQTTHAATNNMETWRWSYVGPMVDFALNWISLKSDPYLSKFVERQKGNKGSSGSEESTVSSVLWVISSVMHMLSSLLERVIPADTFSLHSGHVPWLPEFVPKIGLVIIKNGFFSFTRVNDVENGTAQGKPFLQYLCHLRHQSEQETSVASVCCLQGLFKVVVSTDKLIRLANVEMDGAPSQCGFSQEDKILAVGILKSSVIEVGIVLNTFMKLIASEKDCVQTIEKFGRGGPAPGVGVGWGASGGGYWSTTILLAQMDAGLVIHLLEISHIVFTTGMPTSEEMSLIMQRISCALDISVILGPRDRLIVEKVLDLLLQVPVLKCLDLCIRDFLQLNKGLKLFEWKYKEDDYMLFSNTLASHFKNRWLSFKEKFKSVGQDIVGRKTSKKGRVSLETIHEDLATESTKIREHPITSMVVEWAHQRLPVPNNWFLSPICDISYSKPANPSVSTPDCVQDFTQFLEVDVSLVWKLHALSVILFVGMGVLEDKKSKAVYENLQGVYGQLLDKPRLQETGEEEMAEFLKFQAEIHDSYATFVEALVEQFAAISYGDSIYGRQVAIYLHRFVEAPVRLAAWNALSNIRALELLPPLDICIGDVKGYLEPVEDNERILEAYVKSWVSGALDRAFTRGSVAFTLVLHHLSSFIFGSLTSDRVTVRKKLTKSILRDYSRKPQHEGMLIDFVRYNKPATHQKLVQAEILSPQTCDLEERFKLLKEACEGSSSLLNEVDKLESSIRKEQYVVT